MGFILPGGWYHMQIQDYLFISILEERKNHLPTIKVNIKLDAHNF